MNVLILGAGEVGLLLAERFSQEGESVTVVEMDEAVAAHLRDVHDVLVKIGHAGNPRLLKECGADTADLVVAVTRNDSVNLVAGQLAKALGAHRVVSRVNNLHYFEKPGIGELLGGAIDLYVCSPEETAEEVHRRVSRSPARSVVELGDGRLEIVGVEVGARSSMVGKSLQEIRTDPDAHPFLVLSVTRDGETMIPQGGEVIHLGDIVYLFGEKWIMPDVVELAAGEGKRVKKVFVMGGGRVGRGIARRFQGSGVAVSVIEIDPERCVAVANDLPEATVIQGDGKDVDLLKEEGVGDSDAFVATTPEEETNIMTSLLAQHIGARRAIALVKRADYQPMLPSLGIEEVNPYLTTATSIARFARKDRFLSLTAVGEIGADAIEVLVANGSKIRGKELRKLKFPQGSLVAAVIRDGRTAIPTGETEFLEGDRVFVFTLPAARAKVERMLG